MSRKVSGSTSTSPHEPLDDLLPAGVVRGLQLLDRARTSGCRGRTRRARRRRRLRGRGSRRAAPRSPVPVASGSSTPRRCRSSASQRAMCSAWSRPSSDSSGSAGPSTSSRRIGSACRMSRSSIARSIGCPDVRVCGSKKRDPRTRRSSCSSTDRWTDRRASRRSCVACATTSTCSVYDRRGYGRSVTVGAPFTMAQPGRGPALRSWHDRVGSRGWPQLRRQPRPRRGRGSSRSGARCRRRSSRRCRGPIGGRRRAAATASWPSRERTRIPPRSPSGS